MTLDETGVVAQQLRDLARGGQSVLIYGLPDEPGRMKIKRVDNGSGDDKSVTFVTLDGRYKRTFFLNNITVIPSEGEGIPTAILIG